MSLAAVERSRSESERGSAVMIVVVFLLALMPLAIIVMAVSQQWQRGAAAEAQVGFPHRDWPERGIWARGAVTGDVPDQPSCEEERPRAAIWRA